MSSETNNVLVRGHVLNYTLREQLRVSDKEVYIKERDVKLIISCIYLRERVPTAFHKPTKSIKKSETN